MTQQTFISTLAPIVISVAKTSRILPSLTIAQACLETGYGKHLIGGYALFGIKGNGKMSVTKEYIDGKWITITDSFRTYDSWEASVIDHSKFLTTVKLPNGKLRYAGVIGETDYKKACKAIFAAGYATGKDYDSILISIIERFNLSQYDTFQVQAPPAAAPPLAAAPPTVEKVVAKKVQLYTVKKGDSWWGIAKSELGDGAKYQELAKYNNLPVTSTIFAGQVIKLPPKA